MSGHRLEAGQRWGSDGSTWLILSVDGSSARWKYEKTGEDGSSAIADQPFRSHDFLGWAPGFGPTTAPTVPSPRPEPAVGQRWRVTKGSECHRAGDVLTVVAVDPWVRFDLCQGHGHGKSYLWEAAYAHATYLGMVDAPVPSPGVAETTHTCRPGTRAGSQYDVSCLACCAEFAKNNGLDKLEWHPFPLGAKAAQPPGGQGPESAPALPAPRSPFVSYEMLPLENTTKGICHTCRLGSACTHGPKVREPFIPAVDEWDLLPGVDER